MKYFFTVLAILFVEMSAIGQSDLQSMVDADRSLASRAVETGARSAYLEYLADDGVIFRPDAVRGKEYWNLHPSEPAEILKRKMEFADISASGLLGYTTGVWETEPRVPTGPPRRVGQYVTVWSKKPDGRFLAIIDILTEYDEAAAPVGNPALATTLPRDINKRRWSAADPSMNFLKMGMNEGGLGKAFGEFAAEDIRLIIEENPPIFGKKNTVKAMKKYLSVAFPQKVSLLESSDLAYAWNPCEYANSEEGMERGNCLNIWKLRKKRWYITLGVFARVPNVVRPKLKMSPTNRPN
ncbi:MAG: nuclear transport factor 2 family protein [Pyrinomonadaceae bacterium]